MARCSARHHADDAIVELGFAVAEVDLEEFLGS